MLRVLRFSLLSIAVMVALAFAMVQVQQHIFRHRAERLLTDFQSIRLHQSTWADAQALMTRWGAWGHYDGACTTNDCAYKIELGDAGSRWIRKLRGHSDGLRFQIVERSYELLGGRDGTMEVSFVIQDGVIWRSGIFFMLYVPREGDVLFLKARASDTLRDGQFGDEERLAHHPDYKAHRPDGCEGCMAAWVTFTPDLAPSTLRELTAYNLSCLTRLRHPCANLPDVLPIAKEWNFYPSIEGNTKAPEKPVTPKNCDVPLYALARDADTVVVVDVLSRGTKGDVYVYPEGDRTDEHESATVKVLSTLKGVAPWADGAMIKAVPYVYDSQAPAEAGEPLQPGKRYIVIPMEADRLHVVMSWCGVFEDSPEVRRQLQQGFAQDDALRRRQELANLGW